MVTNPENYANGFLEIVIQGFPVRLVFSEERNTEAPALVREILKDSYLRRNA